ncbi:MAG: hypothetical protein IJX47_07575 [Clostridia bacterium]|nr:hypothetical protein [Clostridia bacterium]
MKIKITFLLICCLVLASVFASCRKFDFSNLDNYNYIIDDYGYLDDAFNITTAGTTVNHTSSIAPTTTIAPITTIALDPDPDEDTPILNGEGLEELLANKTNLNSMINLELLYAIDVTLWDGGEVALFDGIHNYNELDLNAYDYPISCGGWLRDGSDIGAWFGFSLTEEATVTAYVITTGPVTSVYTDRNPIEWTLYATNNEETYMTIIDNGEFNEFEWVVLDYVYDGNIVIGDFLENGYTIDEINQGSYKYYCWYLGWNEGGFQACEFDIYAN